MTLRQLAAGVGCVLLLAAAGCGATGQRGAAAPGVAPGAANTPDAVGSCAELVAFWVRQQVVPGGDQGLDYQEMGLSDGENDIARSLLPAARELAVRQGPAAVGPAAEAWARPRCRTYLAQRSASAEPGGWPR